MHNIVRYYQLADGGNWFAILGTGLWRIAHFIWRFYVVEV